jgi:hypothetical protein
MPNETPPATVWDWEHDLYYPGSGLSNAVSDSLIVEELAGIKEAVREEEGRSGSKNERIAGIYSIECTVTSRQYIGSSIDVHRRRHQHLTQLHAGTHHATKLQQEFVKHGRSSFRFRVLETVSDLDNLRKREQAWLDKTQACSKGLNSSAVATGPEPSASRRLVTLVQWTASRFRGEPPIPPTQAELDTYGNELAAHKRSRIIKWGLRVGALIGIASLLYDRPDKMVAILVISAIPYGLLLLLTTIGEPPDPPHHRLVSPLRKAVEFISEMMFSSGQCESREAAARDIVEALVWEQEILLGGKYFAARNAGYMKSGSRRTRRKEAEEYVEEILADKLVELPR